MLSTKSYLFLKVVLKVFRNFYDRFLFLGFYSILYIQIFLSLLKSGLQGTLDVFKRLVDKRATDLLVHSLWRLNQ